jgi:NAD(P)-dependent dehydrogenase (short-subunit alcohol dehydrogenase family)
MTTSASNLSQRFPKKRVFITGAASGLGLACAEILAREGWQLILVDADVARLDLVANSLGRDGANVISEACDVRDGARLQAIVDRAVTVCGGIDVALLCAGVASAGAFHALSEEDWRWTLDINVLGVANAARAVVRHMAQGKGGLLVNVASAAGFCTGSHMSAYNTSKAAVIALSESLMQEYAQYGIEVMAAMPGFFNTRLLESARGSETTLQGARRLMAGSGLEADEVAERMLASAARGKRYFVYPGKYAVLWRLKRWLPGPFQSLLPRIIGR